MRPLSSGRWLLSCAAALALHGCATDPEALPTPPLTLEARRLAEATVGQPYAEQLVARGGQAPLTWTVEPLPDGILLDSSSGRLRGTPTRPSAEVMLSVRVSDQTGARATATFTVRVRPLRLTITSTSLPAVKEGSSYDVLLGATGGLPPLTWSVTSGTLPRGLTLTARGVLSGRPEVAGTTELTVRVTDAEVAMVERALTLVVRPLVPMIAEGMLPRARFDTPYEHRLTATDVRPPVDWTVVSGRLPRGLGLDITGLIAGRPTEAGLQSFVVRATDGGGRRDEAMLELFVVAPMQFTTRALPVAVTGRAYSAQLAVSGGVPPYRFSVRGALPPGLRFTDDGRLAGMTAALGRYDLVFSVEDSAGSAPRVGAYTLTVSDDFQYEVAGGVSFPSVCTATTVSVVDVPIEVADSFSIQTLRSVSVEYEFTDVDNGFGQPNQRLRLGLLSPSGQYIHLCGDRFAPCPVGMLGTPMSWPPLMWLTPTSVVNNTNARGTWRLRAGVDQPTLGTGGCNQQGRIGVVQLIFQDDPSDQPYSYLRGWSANNLIQLPWLRIWGRNHIGESELDLVLERWSAGPNRIREAGQGDDVLSPDVISWSIVTAPAGTTITPDGHLVSGAVTGRGAVRATDGVGNTTDFDFIVVPPDWNLQRTN